MAYPGQELSFGPEYLIPKPFDPRLITTIAPAVAKAAEESSVATRPITDMAAYKEKLKGIHLPHGVGMRRVHGRQAGRAEAHHLSRRRGQRVLRAVQIALEDASPSRS